MYTQKTYAHTHTHKYSGKILKLGSCGIGKRNKKKINTLLEEFLITKFPSKGEMQRHTWNFGQIKATDFTFHNEFPNQMLDFILFYQFETLLQSTISSSLHIHGIVTTQIAQNCFDDTLCIFGAFVLLTFAPLLLLFMLLLLLLLGMHSISLHFLSWYEIQGKFMIYSLHHLANGMHRNNALNRQMLAKCEQYSSNIFILALSFTL